MNGPGLQTLLQQPPLLIISYSFITIIISPVNLWLPFRCSRAVGIVCQMIFEPWNGVGVGESVSRAALLTSGHDVTMTSPAAAAAQANDTRNRSFYAILLSPLQGALCPTPSTPRAVSIRERWT